MVYAIPLNKEKTTQDISNNSIENKKNENKVFDNEDTEYEITDIEITEDVDSISEDEFDTTSVAIEEEECLSEKCIETSKVILSNLDTSANPCDDFYQFTCGGYKYEFSNTKKAEITTRRNIFTMFENDYKANNNLSKTEQEYEEKLFYKLKNLFSYCKNRKTLKENAKESLVKFINKLNLDENKNSESKDRLTELLIKLHTHYINAFFQVYPEKDDDNEMYININYEIDSGLQFYFSDIEDENKELRIKELLNKLLSIVFNNNEKNIEKMSESIIKLEIIIYNLMNEIRISDNYNEEITSEELFTNNDYDDDFYEDEYPTDDYNYELPKISISVKNLNEEYPLINWKLYLEKILEFYGIHDPVNDELLVKSSNDTFLFLKKLEEKMNEINIDDLIPYFE
eukprot:jgi/Orpsp1_1/1183445/evm.model.c7180000085240.1